VRFALVGCGSIGARHASLIAVQAGADLVGVCDSDPAALADLVGRGLVDRANTWTDYEQLLRDVRADVVDICTPHSLHAPMAIAAAASGRHVLVEKPMALSTADAEEMIRTADRHQVRLMVVKQNRYNQPVVLTRDALLSGRLGRVHLVQCNVLWNRNDDYYRLSPWRGRKACEGGALFTQVSHFIDLLVWWFGDLVSASADIATRAHAIDVEDCGTATLLFDTGVLGQLAWTTCVHRRNYEGSITIVAERGTVKIGGQYLNTIEYWDVDGFPLPDGLAFSDRPNAYGGAYQGSSSNHDKVIRDLVADLQEQRQETVVAGREGLRTVRAIELIYRHAVVRS
jgi:predicted dehydrogenase